MNNFKHFCKFSYLSSFRFSLRRLSNCLFNVYVQGKNVDNMEIFIKVIYDSAENIVDIVYL